LALFTYDLYDSRQIEVLGMLKYEDVLPSNSNIQPRARLKLQASIDSSSQIPQIKVLDTSKVETQVILFTPPNPHEMQFFSLTPITLDLSASDVRIGRRRADSMIIDERDENETRRMDVLVQKMTQHFPRREGQPTQGAEILQASISQV
jgi:phosphatidylinositol glycan class Q protein